MLVGDTESVDRGYSCVDGFSFIVQLFSNTFSEQLAVPVGEADEFLGIWHEDVDGFALFVELVLNFCQLEGEIFFWVLAEKFCAHGLCAAEKFFDIDAN